MSELKECLKALKMSDKDLKETISLYESGKYAEVTKMINKLRKEKLDDAHVIYKDLECIDYIIKELKSR